MKFKILVLNFFLLSNLFGNNSKCEYQDYSNLTDNQIIKFLKEKVNVKDMNIGYPIYGHYIKFSIINTNRQVKVFGAIFYRFSNWNDYSSRAIKAIEHLISYFNITNADIYIVIVNVHYLSSYKKPINLGLYVPLEIKKSNGKQTRNKYLCAIYVWQDDSNTLYHEISHLMYDIIGKEHNEYEIREIAKKFSNDPWESKYYNIYENIQDSESKIEKEENINSESIGNEYNVEE